MNIIFIQMLAYAEFLAVNTVLIPSGTYMMGCDLEFKHLCFQDEYPSHQVTISRPYHMMTHEVTQGEYQSIMGINPSYYQQCGSNCPVEQITWFEAAQFANALSQKMNLRQCYTITHEKVVWDNFSCTGWRLPTEAEWEYAARGNEQYIYAGSSQISQITSTGNRKNEYITQPVCTFQKNAFQLCDMSGNVFEWVWDTYTNYRSKDETDPFIYQANNPSRVRRGGAWCDFEKYCRVSIRYGSYATFRYKYQGFRLVRTAITDSE